MRRSMKGAGGWQGSRGVGGDLGMLQEDVGRPSSFLGGSIRTKNKANIHSLLCTAFTETDALSDNAVCTWYKEVCAGLWVLLDLVTKKVSRNNVDFASPPTLIIPPPKHFCIFFSSIQVLICHFSRKVKLRFGIYDLSWCQSPNITHKIRPNVVWENSSGTSRNLLERLHWRGGRIWLTRGQLCGHDRHPESG